MPVNTHTLPELKWVPTRAFSSRHGSPIRLVVLHRWGGGSLPGVESWFENPADDASSHLVYAGETGRFAGQCAQMVHLADKAWTESGYNPVAVSIECDDAIWLGHDPAGLARLAHITGWLCQHLDIPIRWPSEIEIHRGARGIVRHADLGALGGSHPSCPTVDHNRFVMFLSAVTAEHRRGGYRKDWAR